LSQTGLVGVALFIAFLTLTVASLARAWRSPPDALGRGVAAVAGVVGAYWFLHSRGDWFLGHARGERAAPGLAGDGGQDWSP
jgi:hypothetical protein